MILVMPLTISTLLPSKKDDPIQETPRIEITATIPPRMILPLTASAAFALKKIIIRPAAASMMIMIAWPMVTFPNMTSLPEYISY